MVEQDALCGHGWLKVNTPPWTSLAGKLCPNTSYDELVRVGGWIGGPVAIRERTNMIFGLYPIKLFIFIVLFRNLRLITTPSSSWFDNRAPHGFAEDCWSGTACIL